MCCGERLRVMRVNLESEEEVWRDRRERGIGGKRLLGEKKWLLIEQRRM